MPLIVQEKSKYHNKQFEQEKSKYTIIQEVSIATNPEYSKLKRIFYLWILGLKNEHLWLGICCRGSGTAYSPTQRISVMMVRLLTTMAVSALFYGQSKGSTVGDMVCRVRLITTMAVLAFRVCALVVLVCFFLCVCFITICKDIELI